MTSVSTRTVTSRDLNQGQDDDKVGTSNSYKKLQKLEVNTLPLLLWMKLSNNINKLLYCVSSKIVLGPGLNRHVFEIGNLKVN